MAPIEGFNPNSDEIQSSNPNSTNLNEGIQPTEINQISYGKVTIEDETGAPQEYVYKVTHGPDEDGNPDSFVEFPDLPNCMTQVAPDQDIQAMAQEAAELWVETSRDHGQSIPAPSFRPEGEA